MPKVDSGKGSRISWHRYFASERAERVYVVNTAHSFPEPPHSHQVRKLRPRNKKKKRPKSTVVEGLYEHFDLSPQTRTQVWNTYRRLWKSPDARREIKRLANKDVDPRTLLFVCVVGMMHAPEGPEDAARYIHELATRLELLLSISHQSPVNVWRESFISSTAGDVRLFLERFGPRK